jgi:hypothetical protein
MNTIFRFRSKHFNITTPQDYFINPGCFGDDLASWFIRKLNEREIKTCSKPDQEDFGWYFTFTMHEKEYCVVLGFQPNDISQGDCWVGEIEHHVGFLGSILGGRHRGIDPDAIEAISTVLMSSQEILDLEWHSDSSNRNK